MSLQFSAACPLHGLHVTWTAREKTSEPEPCPTWHAHHPGWARLIELRRGYL